MQSTIWKVGAIPLYEFYIGLLMGMGATPKISTALFLMLFPLKENPEWRGKSAETVKTFGMRKNRLRTG